jgi:hypothetical protein
MTELKLIEKPIPKALRVGTSATVLNPEPKPGWSIWIESGVYFTAPTVDKNKFSGHAYDNGGYEQGIRDCPCGCFMLSSSSGGPVDPFGPCPRNPRKTVTESVQSWLDTWAPNCGAPKFIFEGQFKAMLREVFNEVDGHVFGQGCFVDYDYERFKQIRRELGL